MAGELFVLLLDEDLTSASIRKTRAIAKSLASALDCVLLNVGPCLVQRTVDRADVQFSKAEQGNTLMPRAKRVEQAVVQTHTAERIEPRAQGVNGRKSQLFEDPTDFRRPTSERPARRGTGP